MIMIKGCTHECVSFDVHGTSHYWYLICFYVPSGNSELYIIIDNKIEKSIYINHFLTLYIYIYIYLLATECSCV